MKIDSHSETAEAMAVIRALVSAVPESRGLLDDPHARHFAVGRYRGIFRLARRFPRLAQRVIDLGNPGAVSYIALRHRVFDDAVSAAIADGADQVVLLGAGFDSRALRLGSSGVRFVEIDHPATQAVKRRICEERGWAADLAHVRYVAVDLEVTSLAETLAAIPPSRAIVVWEGVAWYLSEAAVSSTLSALAEWAAPGTRLVFDAIDRDVADGTRVDRLARSHRRYCERRGEPVRWGIDRSEVAPTLQAAGWTLDELEDTQTAASRLWPPASTLASPLPFLFLVAASLSER